MSTVEEGVEYRPMLGDSGYRAGNDGSVWSCLKQAGGRESRWVVGTRWRLKSQQRAKTGYLMVRIRSEFRLVHRIVLEAFTGPCSEGMVACHDDGDRMNNRLDNLRWDTPTANEADKARHGNSLTGERNHNSKLTEADIRAIRGRHAAEQISLTELGRRYGIGRSNVSAIVKRKAWKHVC